MDTLPIAPVSFEEVSLTPEESFDLLMEAPLGNYIHRRMRNMKLLEFCNPVSCAGITADMDTMQANNILYTNIAMLLHKDAKHEFSGIDKREMVTNYYTAPALTPGKRVHIIYAEPYIAIVTENEDANLIMTTHYAIFSILKKQISSLDLLADEENSWLHEDVRYFLGKGIDADAISRRMSKWAARHNAVVKTDIFMSL